jgi:hypothetical protein
VLRGLRELECCKGILQRFHEVWNEFAASSPEGIDYVAEASLQGLMVARIRTL